jgi:hypothetical protein
MIIAIDETGTFNESSTRLNFFIAIQIRQRKTLYRQKHDEFRSWEASIDRSLKNHKGEIKTSSLSDDQLFDFARRVMTGAVPVGITPLAIRPADNPLAVFDKHCAVKLIGIRAGVDWYRKKGRVGLGRTYEELGNWFEKLNYQQRMKILLLEKCVADSFTNAIGHSISGKYDSELTRIRFKIDKDFVREPRTEIFWRELLRNELYSRSVEHPIPVLKEWEENGHPFLDMYHKNGSFDFNLLFRKNCGFENSHEHFEIRVADAVNTIFSRFLNDRRCGRAYNLVRRCILRDGHVQQFVLRDFDLSSYRYDPSKNPFGPTFD